MVNLRSVPFIGLNLLLLLAQGSFSLTLQRSEPFQSQKAPAEIIANYSVVLPVISNKTEAEDGGHPIEFTLIVDNFMVHLILNRDLFPAHFTSKHFDEQGEEVISHGHVNCYYHGWVDGHPDWKATMSTCRGLRGSFGDRSNPDLFYHIEPLYHGDTKIIQPHALYLDSEYTTREANCGTPHTHEGNNIKPLSDELLSDSRNRLRRQNSLGELIVEWAVFNDEAQYVRLGNEVEPTVERALELANYLDMLYKNEYRIRIALVYVETWSAGDRISIPTESSALLNSFEGYSITTHHDSAMLITGVDLDGNTVGIANVGAMCGRFSRGVTQDRGRSVANTGAIAAHEMGHIFNMRHDDPPRACTCNDPSGNCIMASVSGNPPPSLWSSCSQDDLETGFEDLGLNSCLTNEPAVFVGDPVCGNGLKEEGEACDCGSEELCPDPCCNATSCQLAKGAQCFSGGCCNECQFRPYGFTCRGSDHECDITDYCSGESSECPEDARIQNGQICNNNMSYCFSGVCQSRDAQCQTFFGTNNGIDGCYTGYNTRGDQFGNCGHSGGSFIPCADEDIFCGQRFCEFGDYMGNSGVSLFTVSAFDENRVQQRCSAFTISPSADFVSPGLVSDGTRCGGEQLCSLRRCVPLSSLNIPSCAVGANGQVCSGNGQCNTENQCSCFVGFSGSACETIVSIGNAGGGSVAGGIIGALLVIAVIVAVVIVVVVLVVVKKKKGKKHSYPPSSRSQKSHSEHRPSTSGNKYNMSQTVTSVAVVQPSAPPPTYPAPASSQQQRRPPPPSRTAPAKPPPGPPSNVARPSRSAQPNTDPTSRRNVHPPRPPPPGSRPPPPKPAKSDANLSSVNVAPKPSPAPRPQPPTKPRVNVPTSKQPPVARKPMVPPKK